MDVNKTALLWHCATDALRLPTMSGVRNGHCPTPLCGGAITGKGRLLLRRSVAHATMPANVPGSRRKYLDFCRFLINRTV